MRACVSLGLLAVMLTLGLPIGRSATVASAWSSHSASAASQGASASCPLLLHLVPSFQRPDIGVGIVKAPADIPPGPVDIALPAPADSAVADEPYPHPSANPPGTPYAKAAATELAVPSPVSSLMHWYRIHMEECGFTYADHGAVMVHAQVVSRDLGFTFNSSKYGHVALTFEQQSPNSVLVLYFAYLETFPARPLVIYLPGDAIKVDLAERSPDMHVSVTDVSKVRHLAALINSLTAIAVGVRFCGWNNQFGVTMTFRQPSGRTMRVREDHCFRVLIGSYRPLQDDQGVMLYLRGLFAHRPGKQ